MSMQDEDSKRGLLKRLVRFLCIEQSVININKFPPSYGVQKKTTPLQAKIMSSHQTEENNMQMWRNYLNLDPTLGNSISLGNMDY